jgi:hypothetical protein
MPSPFLLNQPFCFNGRMIWNFAPFASALTAGNQGHRAFQDPLCDSQTDAAINIIFGIQPFKKKKNIYQHIYHQNLIRYPPPHPPPTLPPPAPPHPPLDLVLSQ